jgi:hypothetical protein
MEKITEYINLFKLELLGVITKVCTLRGWYIQRKRMI